MRRLMGLLIVGGLLASTASASAADAPFFNFKFKRVSNDRPSLLGRAFTLGDRSTSTPDVTPAAEEFTPRPMPISASNGSDAPAESELYPCVEYEDLDNIHPCAVPMVVSIKDPRACSDPCSCCEPGCVFVEICVPPCGCPKVTVKKHGRKVKYDYGAYRIEVESRRNGIVEVDYDRSLWSRLSDLGKRSAH